MTTIYIGIGSNLDDPSAHVRQAIRELGQLDECLLLSTSSLYKSRALLDPKQSPGHSPNHSPDTREPSPDYPQHQPDYINAVVAIETEKDEISLLDELQAIEHYHGRVRTGERWASRPLDLDVLLVGDKIINQTRLIIPHPGLHQRSFVLYPLQEIAPDLNIPGLGSLKELVARCDEEGLERLSDA